MKNFLQFTLTKELFTKVQLASDIIMTKICYLSVFYMTQEKRDLAATATVLAAALQQSAADEWRGPASATPPCRPSNPVP
jgi:hypothetical protein